MIVILYICLVAFIVFTFSFTKKISHPAIVFGMLWVTIITFSLLGLYNLNKVGNSTYYLLFTGIFSFFLGVIGASAFKGNFKKLRLKPLNDEIKKEIPLHINWRMAYIVLFISMFGTSILFFSTLKYLMSGYSLMQIHNLFYGYGEDTKLMSDTMNAIISWISVPCLYVSISVLIVSFFEKNTKKIFSILTIVSMLFYLFGNASRIMIIVLLFSTIVIYECYHGKIDIKLKRKTKKLLFFCVIMFMILMVARRSNNPNKVNSIYAYLTLPVNLFDYWVSDFKSNSLPYTYGGGYIFGIISWINWFTSKIGMELPVYSVVSQYVINTQNIWVNVFPGRSYNAFCTMFYYFYFDFGIIGIILGSFIYGWICYLVYYKAIIEKNRKMLLMYLLVIQTILFSFIRWQFGTANFIVEIVMSYLIIRGKERQMN